MAGVQVLCSTNNFLSGPHSAASGLERTIWPFCRSLGDVSSTAAPFSNLSGGVGVLADREDISEEAARDVVRNRERMEVLRRTGLLDSAPEEVFDRATRLATRLLGTPVSLVSLVDENRQFFKSQHGLPKPYSDARETPLTHSFCQHVVDRDGPLVVEDARENPIVRTNQAIRDLDVIAYLGVPIRAPGGEALGSFCVIADSPRQWSDDEIELLEDIARGLASEVALRLELLERERAEQEREKALQALEAALEENRLLVREISHRVMNGFQQMGAMIGLQERRLKEGDGRNALAAARVRINSMAAVHKLLYSDPDGANTRSLSTFLERLCGELGRGAAEGGSRVVFESAADAEVDAGKSLMVGLAVTEFVTNAGKHAFGAGSGGTIRVRLDEEDAMLRVTVSDDGKGVPADFALSGSGGLGMIIAQAQARQLGGRVEASNDPGMGGARFKLIWPYPAA